VTRRIRIAFPTGLPAWLSDADVFEVVQIPDSTIFTDYTPTIDHPGNNNNTGGDWKGIVDTESGCTIKEDDSTIIFAWTGGHADGCYNQIVTFRLSDNEPVFEEFDIGSENAIIPLNPQTGTTLVYLTDGRPIGCHNYERVYFLHAGIPSLGNNTPRLVRMGSPATWAWNQTTQACTAYEWDDTIDAEDRTSPAGTIPDIPATGTQLLTASTCKDPLTEDIFWWLGTAIWKWTRATNSWGTAAWKTGAPSAGGLQRPIACNGTQLVIAYGAVFGAPPYVYTVDLATKTLAGPLLVTGSGAEGFQDIRGTVSGGTRARLIWVPPLNSYLLMRGNGATGNNIIYRLQYDGSDWVSEALPLTGAEIPLQTALGPQSKMQWVPGLNGVFYADRGINDFYFFRIA
jgi:hypothetical protein